MITRRTSVFPQLKLVKFNCGKRLRLFGEVSAVKGSVFYWLFGSPEFCEEW